MKRCNSLYKRCLLLHSFLLISHSYIEHKCLSLSVSFRYRVLPLSSEFPFDFSLGRLSHNLVKPFSMWKHCLHLSHSLDVSRYLNLCYNTGMCLWATAAGSKRLAYFSLSGCFRSVASHWFCQQDIADGKKKLVEEAKKKRVDSLLALSNHFYKMHVARSMSQVLSKDRF